MRKGTLKLLIIELLILGILFVLSFKYPIIEKGMYFLYELIKGFCIFVFACICIFVIYIFFSSLKGDIKDNNKINDDIDNLEEMLLERYKSYKKNKNMENEDITDLEKQVVEHYASYLKKSAIKGEDEDSKIVRKHIYPKSREELYNLKKGDYLKTNTRNGKIIREYDEADDTIDILESREVGYGCDKEFFYKLKAEEVFEELGITKEMSYKFYYVNKFKSYIYDIQVILPEKDNKYLDKLFRYYYPCGLRIYTYIKSEFIRKVKRETEFDNDDELGDIFDFFNSQVHPFMYDICLCFVAIHEYDEVPVNEKIRNDINYIYNICKVKLPWIEIDSIDRYLSCIWNEKRSKIEYKTEYNEKIDTLIEGKKAEKKSLYFNSTLFSENSREFIVPVYGKQIPFKVTMEREKDAILFSYHTERENPGIKHFLFHYKGHDVYIILDGSEFVEQNIRKWKLINIDVPEDLSREEVLVELRQAIEVYGCDGSDYKGLFHGKAIADF